MQNKYKQFLKDLNNGKVKWTDESTGTAMHLRDLGYLRQTNSGQWKLSEKALKRLPVF